MKKDIRLVACIIVIILLVLLCLFKCTAEQEDEDGLSPTPTEIAVNIPTRIVSIPGKNDSDNDTPVISLISIEYYTITGAGTTRIDTAETFVEEHVYITPDLIVDYCLDSFMDEEIELNVLHINTEDGICTVDFDDSIYKISSSGRVTEVCALDAIAMSLIDNCEEVKAVTFTINSNEYATEHVSIGLGNAYLSR